MPVEQLPQLIEALASIAGILERLGVPGLLGLLLAGPVAVIIALMLINHAAAKSLSAMHEQARKDTQAIVQQLRSDMANALETYRSDTLDIVKELGKNQMTTAQFYKDNVELVKNYQRMANDLSDLIVSNVSVLQRLAGLIENNMSCPAVREAAHGKK